MRKLTLFAIFLCMTILASGQGSQLPKYTVATLPSAASLPNYIVQVIDGINGGDCIIGGATGSSAYNVECTAHNGAWVSIGGGGAVYPAGTGIPQVVGGASWAATYNSLNQIPANFINLSAYLSTSTAASTYAPIFTLTTSGTSGAASYMGNVINIPQYAVFNAGNDLSGTNTAQNVVGIQNHPIAAPTASGYVFWNGSNWIYQNPAGAGTVTSVGWTGGIVSVANPTTAPAFTIAGTSGGHPYFNSAASWASSGAGITHGVWLAEGPGFSDSTTGAGTAGQPLLSGGTGSDPSYGTLLLGGGGTGATTAAGAVANLGAVPNTTTVNGHTLASNVTISASDLTTGTLPHAQLPALLSGDIPNNAANTSGTAGSVTSSLTMNSSGSGAASGAVFNGSAPLTLSYNTIGAAPTASPTFTGTTTAPVISYGTGWNANSSVSPLAIGSLPWGGGPGNPVVIDAGMNSGTAIQLENDSLNPAAGAVTQTGVGGGATFGSFGTNGPDFFQNATSNIGNPPNTIWGQGVTYVWGENGPVVIGEGGGIFPLCFHWQVGTFITGDASCQILADTNGVHFQYGLPTITPALTLTQVIKQTALTFTAPTTLTSISGTAPNMTITGTFPGGGSNAYANWAFILTGTTHAADVQAFMCSASTTTTLTCDIPAAVAETFPSIAITGVTGTAPGILSFTNTGNNGLTSYSWANFLGFSGLAANLNGTSFQVLSTGLTATTFQVYVAPGGITTTGSSSGVANSAQLLSLATTTYVGTITGGAHNGYNNANRLVTSGFVASAGVNNQAALATYASSATAIATRFTGGVNETQAGAIVSQEVKPSMPVTFDSTYNTGSASATDRLAFVCVPQALTANPAIICTWTHTGSSGGETMAFQNPITTTSTINGATVTGVGTTGTITGTALTATCDSGTASVTGAVVGHPVAVSSTTGADVGGAFNLRASVTSTGTVTVYVCGTGTPASLAYNVTVF